MHKKPKFFKKVREHLRLRGQVTRVSPSIALLHEIADLFGYQFEAFSHLRKLSSCRRIPVHSLYYLRQKGLVKTRRIGDHLQVCLTQEGNRRVLRDRLRMITKRLTKGKVCVVIFDFPESERSRRELWRRFLKWLGMRFLQKSVWYTNRDIGEELGAMVRREGLKEWIQVLEARILTK